MFTDFTAVQSYSYDSLNRLKSAVENVTPHGGSAVQSWKQTFTFDRYGNRRFDFANGNTTFPDPNCPEAICNPTISTANNRMSSTGWQYDAAGNTTTDANGQTFVYDAENKQVQVTNLSGIVGQYFYNGDGLRIKKVVPSTGETTVFVYDASNKLVAEYSTIVEPTSTAKTSYLTNDHLGSPRITTDALGQTIFRRDFHPFGEEIARANYGSDSVRQKFTGYERDNEINLDYAQARYHSFKHGRFTSPDPLMASARRSNPQTFNRYSYVLNRPLSLVDPTGMEPEDDCKRKGTKCPDFYPVPDRGQPKGSVGEVTVYAQDEPITTTTAEISTQITPRPLEQVPAAGFVGPPPVIAPGAPAPVTTAPPGAAPSIGRAVGLLGRTLIASILAPAAIILATPTTVQAPAPLPTGQTTTTTTTTELDRDPMQTIYRVFGGGSAMYGWSWTPVDPRTVPNPRDGLGLPPENSGEFLARGLVRTSNIQMIRPAQPIGPNRGGLPEYIINPRDVIITMRMPLVPPY